MGLIGRQQQRMKRERETIQIEGEGEQEMWRQTDKHVLYCGHNAM